MKEIRDIVKAYQQAVLEGKQTALATVVNVEGSSYRRPGARMLVTEDGQLTGAISGGCLEGDALRKALLVMAQQRPMVVVYDTTDDDDAKLGVGLGCNGIIKILIEPIVAENRTNAIELFKSLLHGRQTAVIVTLFSLQDKRATEQGTCLLHTSENVLINKANRRAVVEYRLAEEALHALQTDASAMKKISEESEYEVFVEVIHPSISLIVVGAGNDALPLIQFSKILGWQTTVIDGRANYATQQRFSKADKVVVEKAQNILEHIAIDEQTAVVLITHNYNYDLTSLEKLLRSNVKYIGCLGPKKKLQRLLDELQDNGLQIDRQVLERLYGPVGLDIGAETSEEIALSIIAEIQAVFCKRTGASLRDRSTPIHVAGTKDLLQH